MPGKEFEAFDRATRQLTPDAPTPLAAVVLQDVSGPAGRAKVQAQLEPHGAFTYLGEAPWPTPHGKPLPQAGDACLVVIDDFNQPWIVGWDEPDWPGPAEAGTGDLHYEFVQASPASTWTIVHKLGKHPSVSAFDTAHDTLLGSIEYPNVEEVIITFSAPTSGVAYLN